MEQPEAGSGRVVAAFDFDGTLSTRDNVVPFLRTAVGLPKLAAALAVIAPRLVVGAVDDRRRDDAKAALVRRTLTGYPANELTAVAERFAERVVRKHLRADAVERAEWHRGQGHELVIVSASLTAYLEPIATRLGFDAVLATDLEAGADGRLTGALAGPNVRRAEKARRLDAWLGGRPAFVWAYGDSTGDRELFERADRAIRVGRRFPRK
ncbi:MAG: HAD-IB family hydrolase [Actinomycetota bacterium]